MSVSELRKSNIAKYLPIVSNDDVMKQLLSPSTDDTEVELFNAIFHELNQKAILDILNIKETTDKSNKQTIKNLNNIVSSILVSAFHALSTNVSFTHDILNFISETTHLDLKRGFKGLNSTQIDKLHNKIMDQMGEFIKVVHEDYNIKYPNNPKKLLSETNFSIKKNIAESDADGKKFKHKKQFGLLAYKKKKKKRGRKNKIELSDDLKYEAGNSGRNSIYNAREIVDYKLKQGEKTKNANNNAAESSKSIDPLDNMLNRISDDNEILIDKDSVSLSFIMLNNPNMRAGTKNSLELSTFFNSLSSIELSKCLPYLDVKFILPADVETKSQNVFKTASVTQFLQGTSISDMLTTDNYKVLEASFVREIGNKNSKEVKKQNAVETNLSAFTMPQTINNFDELYVGHLESYTKELKGKTLNHEFFKRNNTVHDYTKPFLTIKSFNIDVAPTQGLMSFKTGKLSIILHDKSRMSEIAPFIKPDLFGSFGAEIAIKYGWSHMDSMNASKVNIKNNKMNYFGDFLNKNKVYEKYIITNSSYSIDANGQVNIDLAIAMKGPVSIRAINFETDPPKKMADDLLDYLDTRLSNLVESINTDNKKRTKGLQHLDLTTSSLFVIRDKIISEYKSNRNVNQKRNTPGITKLKKRYNKHNRIIRKLNKGKAIEKFKVVKEICVFFRDLSLAELPSVIIEAADNPITDMAVWPMLDDLEIDKYYNFLLDLYNRFVKLLLVANGELDSTRREHGKTIKGLLQKITDGLSLEDPFFDIINFSDVERISGIDLNQNNPEKEEIYSSIRGIDQNNSKDKTLTSFVSLGNIILAVIGTHLTFTHSFEEVQIVSYTLNDHAGVAMNKNIASLLVDKSELNTFLNDLFKNGAEYTLESLLTQIIKKFFVTRYCPNYGLRDLYRINENGNVEPNAGKKSKPSDFKKIVDKRIQKIHEELYKGEDSLIPDVKFVMPKIKLLFDTMTTEESGGNDTILRISMFDQNDNPFTSVTSIMNKVFESSVQEAVSDINKRRIGLKSLAKKNRNYSKSKKEFIEHNKNLINKLLDKGFLKKVSGQYVINSSERYAFSSIKERIKGFMPSLTYGTHNSGIIDASISTINEAKLNTVYLTRPGRNDNRLKTKVRYQQDLPLRILPSQANVTVYGCPFVNFAQYLFLDFETNTTVDNQYAVTGIKHEISPGKFTTSLTLSYGDAYGKYETIVDTLSRTIGEIEQGTLDTDQEEQRGINTKKFIQLDFDSTKNNKNLIEIKDKKSNLKRITIGKEKVYNNELDLDVDYLDLNVSIKSIRLINYKDLDKVFYRIRVLKDNESEDNESQINFEELILACSEYNKNKQKEYYIDLSNKILKNEEKFKIINNDSDAYTILSAIFLNNNTSGKPDNVSNRKIFRKIIESNKELFSFLIKIFLFPYIKIKIKERDNNSSFNEIDFRSSSDDTIELIFFEDMPKIVKDKILTDVINKSFNILKKEKIEGSFKNYKNKKNTTGSYSIKDLRVNNDGEINLILNFTYKSRNKTRNLVLELPLNESLIDYRRFFNDELDMMLDLRLEPETIRRINGILKYDN